MMETRHSSLIIAHGGVWNDNLYDGGRKEYIPIPSGGITYEDLLSKLEIRLKKDKSIFIFEVDALITSPTGEIMRMKVTNDFELDVLTKMLEIPTIYVSVYPRDIQALSKVTRRNHLRVAQKPVVDDVVCIEDVPALDDVLDDDALVCDPHMSLDDDVDEVAYAVGDGLHDYVAEDRDLMPPLDVSNENNRENPQTSRWWVVPGASHQAAVLCEDLVIADPLVSEELCVSGFFANKVRMKEVLGIYHLKNHLDFLTKKSNKRRYCVRCKYEDRCGFIMKARTIGKTWRIYEWALHTCVTDLRYHHLPRVPAKVIASYFCPKLDYVAELRPREIQRQLLREHGVYVRYHYALAGRNQALSSTYGDADDSFQDLHRYFYMLERANPGAVVDLQTCSDDKFEYCFFALPACIGAFRSCRPVFVIDATHLRGKYKCVMFVAATTDGNGQIVPLAFGIRDKGNDSSWTWFLQRVRRSFGAPENLLIVSDQDLSIRNAVASVFPGSHHGLCTWHIQQNLNTFGIPVIDTFRAAAGCYKSIDFEEHMKNLMVMAPRAHQKLLKLDPCRWARSKCPVRRYEYGTSNGCEVLNARLKWARKLPVCPLLESVRTLIQQWFYERRTIAGGRTMELTVWATTRLGKAVEAGRSMRVEAISDVIFKVISGIKSNVVDIAARECSCLVFQFDLIPCSHAAAAISHVRQSPLSYVDNFYSTQTWRDIYVGEVMPIPNKDDWCVPPEVDARVVLTPSNPRQAGRPRTRRIRSGFSSSGKRSCSRCGGKGHYSSTCTAVLESIVEEVGSSQSCAKKPRQQKKCGICGVVGHTRKKCQSPNRFE